MRTQRLLQSINAGLCIFEWGDGVADLAKADGVLSRVRPALFTDFVLQAQLSAKQLGIPTVSLPHGHSTKLNLIRSKQVEQALSNNNGKLPFANRDSLDAYVFAPTITVMSLWATPRCRATTLRCGALLVFHANGCTCCIALHRRCNCQHLMARSNIECSSSCLSGTTWWTVAQPLRCFMHWAILPIFNW